MKAKLFFSLILISSLLEAQTIVSYPAQVAEYSATFVNSPGPDTGIISSTWAEGMNLRANGAGNQAVAWRNFTDDGTSTGTPITMAVGDIFTFVFNSSKSSTGEMGIALLSSPSSTASWADRHNNYALQVTAATTNPLTIVSNGGTTHATSIFLGPTGNDWKNTTYVFTLLSATTMQVDVSDSGGTDSSTVTLNNTNITGFALYAEDTNSGLWDSELYIENSYGSQYSIAGALGVDDITSLENIIMYYNDGVINLKGTNIPNDYTLKVYDISGRFIKAFEKNESLRITLAPSLYIVNLMNNLDGKSITKKITIN